MSLNVYFDTGGTHATVAELESAGLLKTHYFPFEQRNRKVKNFVPGSGSTWKQANLSWKEEVGSWDNDNASPEFPQILKSVGGQKVDAQHLDSAHKSGCTVFLTSDKTDVWSKRAELFALLGIRVLHMPTETGDLRKLACLE